ncbi:TPA: hypothetical protein HA361_01640 [Candidatus Woesearchaeota archaeon]|nr:hypothetical protein [Candidatus Woesearchaeota archaeon]HII69536.1 hypothetical protein [Candidatus Woesearchaeota archaeon]
MKTKTVFISDLHMFSRRSKPEQYLLDIKEAAKSANTFVFGGDIFDFEWTVFDSVEETVDTAAYWLDSLVAGHPSCSFHFVLGNHDFNLELMEQLDRLSQKHNHFQWHRYFVRIGNALFLHGDISGSMEHNDLIAARVRCLAHQKKSKALHVLYDAVVHTNMHNVIAKTANPAQKVIRNIHSYVMSLGEGYHTGLRSVYFGHTHVPVEGHEYGGISFHNGGAPMKGIRFKVIEAEIGQSNGASYGREE